jgi:hypothetical protein
VRARLDQDTEFNGSLPIIRGRVSPNILLIAQAPEDMRGFRQFDAPVSIVLTYEKIMEPAAVSQFDLGAVC